MFIINIFSTCFGHHYTHLQENKTCVTARGVLRWFYCMWLVAVVGRCGVGCEQCSLALHKLVCKILLLTMWPTLALEKNTPRANNLWFLP